jgi:hypothetical protein
MKSSSKTFLATLVLCFLVLAFGQLPETGSQLVNIEDKALTYIKNVLPFDFESYNISVMSYRLPKSPNSTYQTDAVDVMLNSTESLLAANCLFRHGVQYTCDLRAIKGSPKYVEEHSDLVQVTRRIIQRHQAQTGVDSTDLLRTLDMVETAEKFCIVTQGNLNLSVFQARIPTGLKMVNGSLHIDPTKTHGITTFLWQYKIEGADQVIVLIDFENGVLHSLHDGRILRGIGRSDKETGIQLEPAPASFVILAAALPSGAIVGVCLGFYFKRRKTAENVNKHS